MKVQVVNAIDYTPKIFPNLFLLQAKLYVILVKKIYVLAEKRVMSFQQSIR